MIRILHIITGLGIGGAERMLERLVLGQPLPGSTHRVVSLGQEGPVGANLAREGVEVFAVGMPRGRPTLAGTQRLIRWTREFRPDLIQGWMYHGNLAASVAARWGARGVPLLWTVRHALHDLDQEPPRTRWLIRFQGRLRSADRIVFNSQVAAEQHHQLGYPADRSRIIANGFDTERFRPDLAAAGWLRRRLGIPETARLIGRIGRNHPTKDHPTFLEAARQAASAGYPWHFLLAGPGLDAGLPELRPFLTDSTLRGRLHVTGEWAEMPSLLAGLDVLTSCSRSEAFPNVVGEAMACGVPCVVTDVGASRELVGETGIVVEPGSSAALVAGWEQLLVDEGTRHQLGQAARMRIEQEYSMAQLSLCFAELYRELVGPTPVRS